MKIKVIPTNGIDIPGIGHLKHGAHDVDITAAEVKKMDGVAVVKAGGQGKSAGGQGS